MSYEAIITPIVNIRQHPNADRLNLGSAAGHQVIVSTDVEEGTLGILFPPDGQLSTKLCVENNLFRHTEYNKDKDAKAGFFEDNRRVKAQKLRGAISEGFWTQLSVLEYTEADLSKLKTGDLIKELNGETICEKYYTRATRMAMSNGKNKGKNSKKSQIKASFPQFKEHFNTQQLRMMVNLIPKGAVLSITEKCHGTSGRTGYLPQEIKVGKFKSWWNKTFKKLQFITSNYDYVSGSRRVVLANSIENGYYGGTDFRNKVHQMIKSSSLNKGETLYYEIVGFTDTGSAIMGNHGIQDPKVKKKYGDTMTYSYGCDPTNLYKVLVYRITLTSPSGRAYELPWHQMNLRCKELGIEAVPQLKEPFIYDGDSDGLMKLCEALSQGDSTLDSKHIKEGVVVRVEAPGVESHFKYKGFLFCELEGIRKNTDEYVDLEEIS